MAKLLKGLAWLLLPAVVVFFLQWRVPFSRLASVTETFHAPQNRLLQALPSSPGCWVRSPSGCPNQPSASFVPTSSAWIQDTYGEANFNAGGDQAVCETRRRQAYDFWCGSSDTVTYFVPLVAPSIPGCWVRSPSGCPNNLPASWVPTSSAWMQDWYGEANLNAGGDRSVCEVTRLQDYNLWCGSSDTVTYFVAPQAPSTPGCWVRFPTGCPTQPASWVPAATAWMQDAYGEATFNSGGDQAVCEGRRRQDYNFWCSSSDTVMHFVALPAPSTPGCWVRSPSNCPNKLPSSWVPTSSAWMQDWYGEASLKSGEDRSVCEGRRPQDYNFWCGSSDTEVYFVQNVTSDSTTTTTTTTTHAVPSSAGCWVRAPSGCPNQIAASWVPTSSGWMQDEYGDTNYNAGGDQAVCEGRRRQDYNFWCGSSDIETYFVQVCKSKSTNTADDGWADHYRGWYDVQGCGTCHDYCRWVGTSGSGGHPLDRTTWETSYWSCRLAGGSESHSSHTSWSLGKCSGEGANAPESCSAFSTSSTCPTSLCSWRGSVCEASPSQWGICQTPSYCYYASSGGASYGNASSTYESCGWYYSSYSSTNCGSLPTCPSNSCHVQVVPSTPVPSTPGCWVLSPSECPSQQSAYWVPTSSAWMQDTYGEATYNAGGDRSICEGTRVQDYNTWCGSSDTATYFVPTVTPICLPKSTSTLDDGYPDDNRGWYDVQGCGKCFDYCRWVGGNSGPGGKPTQSTTHGDAFWSCRLAGGSATHSLYTSWTLERCSGEGANAPQETR